MLGQRTPGDPFCNHFSGADEETEETKPDPISFNLNWSSCTLDETRLQKIFVPLGSVCQIDAADKPSVAGGTLRHT